jgi:uncharacterized membrane protein YebE (DUF533 family)
MNFSDLLGGMLQSGLSRSSGDRARNVLGGGSGAGGLGELIGGLSGMLGGQQGGGGGLGGALSGMLGGGSGGQGGLGGVLGSVLGEAGRAVGGNQNLALGGLGALAGALLGGGGKSMGGALGGGVMALLGAMAFQALRGSGSGEPAVPLGLRTPQTEAEQEELEHSAEIVLRAMINAAKSDGQIDAGEIQRIVGKLDEMGADKDSQAFVLTQMRQPLETESLIAAAAGNPQLATQIYGASLLAIEVDTPAEKDYMAKLASGLRLSPEVVGRVKEIVGLQPA